jgi:Flp pilus assembly protein TadG
MITLFKPISRYLKRIPPQLSNKLLPAHGQGAVEFTLVFLLFVIVAWIPAEFGLAFYAQQQAQNAAREGARLAAATNPFDANDIRTQTCKRLSAAPFSAPTAGANCAPYSRARVTVATTGSVATCDMAVRVTVNGNYNFFFYQLIRLLGFPVASTSNPITTTSNVRYEWQSSVCP